MEPQDMNYCCINNKEEKNRKCRCINLIFFILLALFLVALSLILGAVFAETLLANIAVLILGAVIAGILTIITIIYKICVCKRRKCC